MNEFMLIATMQAFQSWAATLEMDVYIVWMPDFSGWIGDENLGTPLEFKTPQEALTWLLAELRIGNPGVQHG